LTLGPVKISLALASTAVLLGLEFYLKAQSPFLHLIHSFSLAQVFNK
jgi:hypothetical protein